jgi:Uma2 family endonuclease
MVAPRLNSLERFVRPPESFIAGRMLVPALTRTDAEAMMRIGIIPEDASTELLDGIIVLKDRSSVGQDLRMIGQDHRKCVERLSALRKLIDGDTRHVESQQPLVCAETHVPEPDFMVLRGILDQYTDLPAAADAFCVIEVADSSYERDAGPKLRGYARAGVTQYVIIDLRNRTAEVYGDPDPQAGTAGPPTVITAGHPLSLRVGVEDYFAVLLSDVLP